MSEIHILAILTPAHGKADRLKEVIANTVKGVLHNEPDTLMFRFFEEANANGTSVIYAEETYKDQAAMDVHLNNTWFQAAGKAFAEENLLGSPLEVKTIRPFAGFKSR